MFLGDCNSLFDNKRICPQNNILNHGLWCEKSYKNQIQLQTMF